MTLHVYVRILRLGYRTPSLRDPGPSVVLRTWQILSLSLQIISRRAELKVSKYRQPILPLQVLSCAVLEHSLAKLSVSYKTTTGMKFWVIILLISSRVRIMARSLLLHS